MSCRFRIFLAASTLALLVSIADSHQDLELSRSNFIPTQPPRIQAAKSGPDFLDLSEVPQLRTTGILDILSDDKQISAVDTIPFPDSVVVFNRPANIVSRQPVAPTYTPSDSIALKKDELWNLLKRSVVPHLQTTRLPSPFSSGEENHKGNENPNWKLLVKLLPWTITHAKVLVRITPALAGYVFGKFPQLLIPLYAAQRIYHFFYLFGRDWYTGRYLRIKFERMQRQYKTEYRIPECLRSVSRFFSHLVLLLLIGRWVEWMLSLMSAPCKVLYGGCNIWCGTIWVGAVLGAGHAVGVAIAIWGGPMRIQVDDLQRPSIQNIRRPLRLARWILDPDKWFRDIIARDRFMPSKTLKPFNPEAVLFPSTWTLLKMLQMVAVVQHMQGPRMMWMMKKILLQQALSDEWYRVLMCEKRVAWAMVFMAMVRCFQKKCVTQHFIVAWIISRHVVRNYAFQSSWEYWYIPCFAVSSRSDHI